MDNIGFDARGVHNERWATTLHGYEVSCRGRARGPNGILKPWPSSRGGYLHIQIRGRKHRLHRLIVSAFRGPIPDGMFIDHVNGVKTDNRLENLEVVSHRENIDRAKALGLFKGYSGPPTRRTITPSEREEIVRLRRQGMSWPKMVAATGRSASVLQRVVQRAEASA